jgi:hypothetical protein
LGNRVSTSIAIASGFYTSNEFSFLFAKVKVNISLPISTGCFYRYVNVSFSRGLRVKDQMVLEAQCGIIDIGLGEESQTTVSEGCISENSSKALEFRVEAVGSSCPEGRPCSWIMG